MKLDEAIATLIGQYPLLQLREQRETLLGGSTRQGVLFDPGENGPETYRTLYWNIWDETLPALLAMMLNPSTADHRQRDNTVTLLVNRAARTKHGGLIIGNSADIRATDPKHMLTSKAPQSPANQAAIRALLQIRPATLLCAWGDNISEEMERHILDVVAKSGVTPHALGITKSRRPKHPLRIGYETTMKPWLTQPEPMGEIPALS